MTDEQKKEFWQAIQKQRELNIRLTGKHWVENMLEAARREGLDYCPIADGEKLRNGRKDRWLKDLNED